MDEPKDTKQTKTAEEVQAKILKDLRKVDGYPEKGVNSTVYGVDDDVRRCCRPARNKTELQGFFEIITERLQRLYDVA